MLPGPYYYNNGKMSLFDLNVHIEECSPPEMTPELLNEIYAHTQVNLTDEEIEQMYRQFDR